MWGVVALFVADVHWRVQNAVTFSSLHTANKHQVWLTSGAGANGQNLLDSTKFYLALKCQDWDLALQSRRALYQQNEESYRVGMEQAVFSEQGQLRREKELLQLQEEIIRLEERDTEYFQKIIDTNEKASIEVLTTYIGIE